MFVQRTSERVLREAFGFDARNPPDLLLLGPDNRLLPDPDYPDTVFRNRSLAEAPRLTANPVLDFYVQQ